VSFSDGETPELQALDSRIDKLEKLAAQTCEVCLTTRPWLIVLNESQEHPPPPLPKSTFLDTLPLLQPVIPISAPSPPEIPSSHESEAEAEPFKEPPLPSPAEIESSLLPAEPLLPEFSFIRTQPTQASEQPQAEFQLNVVQEELTGQLALMSRQLKLNAIHFGERLAADVGVVMEAEEKLAGNLDRMRKERFRLRDYSSTARGTTCLVLGAILVVVVAWVMMFVVIRIT